MVAPSIRSIGAQTVGPSATPTFAEPAGAQPSDVIVCAWFQDDARTTIDQGALPTGFAAAPDTPQANNPLIGSSPNHSLQVYAGRRSAVGAGPYAFVVVPGTGGATPFIEGRAAAVQDCILSGSFFDAADGNTTGTASDTVAPSVSATSSGLDRFAFYMATNWNGGAWTDPAGFTNVMNSTNRLLTWDSKTLATVQTVTPQAVNSASQRMNAWVGIFLPVPSAVTVTGSATVDLGGLTVAATGKRTAVGVATVNLGGLTASASAITGGPVILPDDMYRPGPCRNYDYVSSCDLTGSEAVSGYALEAASEIIFYASGQRFDTCQVTIRPCRKDCWGDAWPRLSSGWWEFGSGPQPLLYAGNWYNIACGMCGTNCSCSIVSETILPGPVREIVQVTVDGEVLDPTTDYRLDDYRKLVRLGGNLWPLCNDLNKGITEVGTWSVTAIYGEPLPTLGKLAVGQLLCDIINDLINNDCSLPDNVTDITRQGLSFSLDDVNDAVKSGFDTLKYVNKFIERYNPNKLAARPRLYDIDGPDFRVTGTTIL